MRKRRGSKDVKVKEASHRGSFNIAPPRFSPLTPSSTRPLTAKRKSKSLPTWCCPFQSSLMRPCEGWSARLDHASAFEQHTRTARAGVINGSRECRCDAIRNEIKELCFCIMNVSVCV